jgi:predicted aldo/keto reductase-like oxidoreductase
MEKGDSMRYRLLGNSGLRVSEAVLGTMTFGEEWGWGSGTHETRKVYDAFREAGGNFIDTANFYTNGTSELFLGEFTKGHRQSVVLATKYSNAAPGTDPNAAATTEKVWCKQWKQVCSGCKPTTSTCTRSIFGTKLRLSKRSCVAGRFDSPREGAIRRNL